MNASTTPATPPSLLDLANAVAEARTLEELVRPLLDLLEEVTGLDSTYLTRIDDAAGLQHVLYARNSRRLQIPEGLDVPWHDTLCKRALDEGRTYTDDVAGCWGDSDAARALGIATYASTPVRTSDGAVYGTLCAASDQRRPMANGGDRVMQLFAQLIGQHVDREHAMQQLRRANDALALSALTDSVTGLPNRRALMEELERRLARSDREHSSLLVAFVDLDGFKAINDVHGHEAGDRFLHRIGAALKHAARAGDFSARLGGDEFVVLANAPSEGGPVAIEALRERLQQATSGRFALGESASIDYAGPSIGVILAAAHARADDVLAQADAAMYAIKRARRSARG
jgi:diguanylate cyclase